jgi:hypothetical protein
MKGRVKRFRRESNMSFERRWAVKSGRIILGVALVLFVASFFMTAVGSLYGGRIGPSIPGYLCAIITFLDPWRAEGLKSLREEPLLFLSLVFSGWINPVFLVTLISLLRKPSENLGRKLRIVLLFMLPACWVAFFEEHAIPGFGYFLWTISMILALYSTSFSRVTLIQEPDVPFRSVPSS